MPVSAPIEDDEDGKLPFNLPKPIGEVLGDKEKREKQEEFPLLPIQPAQFPEVCKRLKNLSVGSPEFCGLLNEIVADLKRIGDVFLVDILGMDPETCQAAKAGGGNSSFWDEITKGITGAIVGPSTKPLRKALTGSVTSLLVGVGLPQEIARAVAEKMDIAAFIGYFKNLVCQTWVGLARCLPCSSEALVIALAVKALVKFLEDIPTRALVGVNFLVECDIDITAHIRLELPPWDIVIDYIIHWACPVRILEQGEVIEGYARGYITKDHYSCLMKLHGTSEWFHDLAVRLRFERLTPEEVIRLSMREAAGFQKNAGDALLQLGLTPNEAMDLATRIDDDLTASGWANNLDKNGKIGLAVEIPTITDHLEWQRRNVDDPTYTIPFMLWSGFDTIDNVKALMDDIYTRNGYLPGHQKAYDDAWLEARAIGVPAFLKDRNFWETFKPDLQAQGMTKRAALFHYMQHWQPVPPTFGYRFLHRLRPGVAPAGQEFTRDNLRRVLLEAGWQPTMIDRLIETSYNVITRIDARRAYISGAIARHQFLKQIQDQGYTLSDAEIIAHFTDTVAIDQAARSPILKGYANGTRDWTDVRDELIKIFPTVDIKVHGDPALTLRLSLLVTDLRRRALRKAIISEDMAKGYVTGVVSEEELLAYWHDNKELTNDEKKNLLMELRSRRNRRSRNRCITEVHSRIKGGEITPDEAGNFLLSFGTPQDLAQHKVNEWKCEFAVAWKQPSKMELCKLAQEGLISMPEYMARLRRLGYDAGISAALVQECVLNKMTKAQKLADEAKKRADAAKEKAKKAHERVMTTALREVEKYTRQSNQLQVIISRAEAAAKKESKHDDEKAKADKQKANRAKEQIEVRGYTAGLGFVSVLVKAAKGQAYDFEQLLQFSTWQIHNVAKQLELPTTAVTLAAKAILANYNPAVNHDVIDFLGQGLRAYYGTLGAIQPPPGYNPPRPIETKPPGAVLPPPPPPLPLPSLPSPAGTEPAPIEIVSPSSESGDLDLTSPSSEQPPTTSPPVQ